MPQRKSARADWAKAVIDAHCDCANRSFAVTISDISCDGCHIEADVDWADSKDFLRLRIADRIEINGRVQWHRGNRARIGFFGQLHPLVVDELARAA